MHRRLRSATTQTPALPHDVQAPLALPEQLWWAVARSPQKLGRSLLVTSSKTLAKNVWNSTEKIVLACIWLFPLSTPQMGKMAKDNLFWGPCFLVDEKECSDPLYHSSFYLSSEQNVFCLCCSNVKCCSRCVNLLVQYICHDIKVQCLATWHCMFITIDLELN